MNILVVGSGAREQAIVSALHRSPQHPHIYCCGSSINPAIQQMVHHYWTGNINDVVAITELALSWQIGLVIIGPESPLNLGLADQLWQHSIPTIGPKKKLAQIETSKIFARNLMKKYNIAGLPNYRSFNNILGIADFLKELGENNYVVKANGLMSGKGVKVAGDHLFSHEEAIDFCETILEKEILIEEKLLGQEFSLMCFCDGKNIFPMPLVQDHKRAFVDDKGPNTGGMGSYSNIDHQLPFLTPEEVKEAIDVNHQVFKALSNELGEKYIGILYGSFIATAKGLYVIEFNARFGDPEALNVLSILNSDFVAICQAMVTGSLSIDHIQFAPLATVCKYAVPEGYPDAPLKDAVIDISAVKNKTQLFLASVDFKDGKIVMKNGRAAAYVASHEHSISSAEEIAEKEISAIAGPLFHREDIGTDKLIQKRIDEMRKLREQ
jgi:phosphoribosylamine--glycine ligase